LCPTAWSCLDSNATYHNDPVDIWGTTARGTNYCWPDSLGGVLTGSTHADSSGLGLPAAGAGDQSTGSAHHDAAASVAIGGSESGTAGTNGSSTTTPAPASSKSGCAIGGHGATSTPFALLAAVLIGLLCLGRARKK
jgi:hypothetical protein